MRIIRCLGLIVAVLFALSAAAAFAADADVLHACAQKKKGTLRLVQGSTDCDKNEVYAQWNVTGPEGPVGPKGDPGQPGLPGPEGPKGDPFIDTA